MAVAALTRYDALVSVRATAMKKRSKTGSKPAKAPSRRASKPKGRSAPKAVTRRGSSAAGQEGEFARLTRELNEALAPEVAASEVLHVISSSRGDLQPVFASVLENAVRLCEAHFSVLLLKEGTIFRLVATHNAPPAYVEFRQREPTISASGVLKRVTSTEQPLHISDCTEDTSYKQGDTDFIRFVELCNVRTLLAAPILKDRKLIGILAVYRQEVSLFTDRQIELVKNFAAQAVIAIENARLLNELRMRTTDLTESLEQQTATSEVLKVISSSPGDLQPVFDSMLEKAVRICEAKFGNLWLREGDLFRVAAIHGAPAAYREMLLRAAIRPGPDTGLGMLLKTKRFVQIDDITKGKAYLERDPLRVATVELGGARTLAEVPLLKNGELIGSINIYHQEVKPFTEKQIELLTNFATQAVIAIENTRLLNELRESLQEQTATAEVLQVISSSSGDLQPVFEAMLEKAVRICDAKFGNIYRWDGELMHFLAAHNTPQALAEIRKRSPWRPSYTDRMATTKEVFHLPDAVAGEDYAIERRPATVAAVELGGARTLLAVPMLKENELVGSFTLYRQEVRPFTDKQIELVKNFAAQAVIAIENARLLNELRVSLQEQTATSEVLQVINSSPGHLEPVFAAMLGNAARLCDAKFGNIFRWDGEALRLVATHNTPSAFIEARTRSPLRPNRDNPIGHMLATRSTVHISDLAADARYTERTDPDVTFAVELGGIRTFVAVPMVKEKKLIGALILYRQEVRPFSGKQIELLENFASQAVIAIENARLLNELRQRTADLSQRTTDLTESLEQQTATSEVLQVISSSPGDLEPVFAAMLEKAARICDATFGNIYRSDGNAVHLVAAYNTPPAFADALRSSPLHRAGITGRIMATKTTIHVADLAADRAYAERYPQTVAAVELGGVRSLLVVPMLKEEELIGAFALSRQEVRPFTGKQIELVQNFAAQAVIAIENVRLLNELRDRTTQLEVQSQTVAKLNQQLEQRVADQVGEIERLGRLRRFLPPQVADLIVASGAEKQLESHRREITALFCDLRGFTGFSEAADPEDVMSLLRDYHAAIGGIIIKYSGTLERYAGDGVMVVFNDPVPVERPALQAVLMALEMRDAIGGLTGNWRELGHDVDFGIGIAHGYATLGTIGFEGRFDYAAIGTVSNVASRLCDEAKPGQILISPRVFTAVKDAVTVEPVGEFTLKGIGRPLAAYNVLAAAPPNA